MNPELYFDRDGSRLPADATAEDVARVWSQDNRLVASTYVGETHISTVLLVIDHNHFADDDPIIFESMVFGYLPPRTRWQRFTRKPAAETETEYQWRYRTIDEATHGHLRIHTAVENGTLDDCDPYDPRTP